MNKLRRNWKTCVAISAAVFGGVFAGTQIPMPEPHDQTLTNSINGDDFTLFLSPSLDGTAVIYRDQNGDQFTVAHFNGYGEQAQNWMKEAYKDLTIGGPDQTDIAKQLELREIGRAALSYHTPDATIE